METVYYLLHQCQAALGDNGVSVGDVGLSLLTACATLGGAALGAWLGARGAYRATAKAGFDLVRRQKMEEAITELHRLSHDERSRMAKIHSELRKHGPINAYMVASGDKIDLTFGVRFPLLTTIEIYFEDGYESADQLWDAMLDFGILVHTLPDYDSDNKEPLRKMDEISHQFQVAHSSLLKQLKTALKESP